MADSIVFTGFWINWSKGPILGATMTTTSQHGFLLVAFLALFVRMVGGHFWSVLCFVIHQLKSDPGPRDGLHHQHQLLLRNSQSQTSTLWDLTKLAVYWRSSARRSFWRTIPLILVAILQLVIFAAAGLFSSHIASSSDEVLVRSQYCGYIQVPDNLKTSRAREQQADAFISERTAALWSSGYAQNCYQKNLTASDCNVFAVPSIQSSYNRTDCPFASDMCLGADGGALQALTEYVNSDIHLGVNSRRIHSVNYRKKTTCAPLRTEGFTRWDADHEWLNFYYGQDVNSAGQIDAEWTWSFNSYLTNETNKAYYLDYSYAELGDQFGSYFIPISRLNRTDADVTLAFLTNFAIYNEKVTDPFFNATNQTGPGQFIADSPIAVMGCTEQHQLCDAHTNTCSPFTGVGVLGNLEQFSGEQLVIARHVFDAIDDNLLNNMVFYLGDAALKANFHLFSGSNSRASGPLPSDQWIAEVTAWHSYTMARMQKTMYDFATGPSDPTFNQYITPQASKDKSTFDLCSNQKVRDSHYYSFSVLGLGITFLVGGSIVLLNLFLSTCVGWYQRVTGKGIHRYEHWKLDHSLQVQRMAYENAGMGRWKGKHSLVPVTGMGERFDKPTRGVADGASVVSPLFTPDTGYSPYTMTSHEASPFFKGEHGVGIVVREARY